MGALDWGIFAAYLALVLWLGWRASRRTADVDEYLLAGRSMPWWAVGLSIMATQASAITVIGTTGQGWREGLGFAQFYLGLPLAMGILAYTLLPRLREARVSTAYELLGRRFDERTRLATALLFLVSRGLALGVVVYAPSVVLSLLLGIDTATGIALMTVVALLYTVAGGLRAVILTDVLQMALVLGGLGAALVAMLSDLPTGVHLSGLMSLAERTGRLELLDWSFDPAEKYTVWSGLLGGTFLFLAYFGCDQSQVQRLLAARSLGHARRALLLNAVAKIPVQLFVLFLGAVLFGVLQFDDRQPLLFDGRVEPAIAAAGLGAELEALRATHTDVLTARHQAALPLVRAGGDARPWEAQEHALGAVRAEAIALASRAGVQDVDDTNHVFPWFLVRRLPVGLVGLLVAAVFAAAMSSIDSELNALATTSVIDVWQRHVRPAADAAELVAVSRAATVLWAGVAATFALQAAALGSVIEAVNAVGSMFYGSLLGVFVLAVAFPSARASGAFWGLIAGMLAVGLSSRAGLAWLWLNPIGCLVAVGTGLALSAAETRRGGQRPPSTPGSSIGG